MQALNVLDAFAPGRPSSRATPRAAPRMPRSSYDVTQGVPTVQRTDRLLDQIAIGVATVNRDYDVLTINHAARRLLGIQTPAIGEDLIHRVPPELSAPLRIGIDGALRGEPTSTMLRRPRDLVDGEARDLRVTCSPLGAPSADDQANLILLQITDVTSDARERERLDGERMRLDAENVELQTRADAAIAELRELRTVNQAMTMEQGQIRMEVELLQVAQEEAQAAAEEIETLNEELQATNEELETVNEEMQATVEELQATIGELNTANEELQARGIELERMTVALEAQRLEADAERSRLAAILATMSDAVLVVNAGGEVVLNNAAYDQMFGEAGDFAPEDDAGNPLPEELWPRQRAARGETFTMPFTLIGADGARQWYESVGQPAAGSNDVPWGVLVIRDITDRSLRRQQEQFLAVAAHELRTPLAVLSGRLQLLLRRLSGNENDQRLKEHATLALEQARRLEADVNELLDAARMQFGLLVLDREPLDLAAVVNDSVSMAQPLTAGQEIRAKTAESPLLVDGDRRRLQRVLLNLLTNAITYAPGTGRIDVRLTRAGNEAQIEVRDTGPGIPEEAMGRIFSRFTQGVTGRSAKGGLGLGLFIAREIVTAHGGTIDAESTPSEGTTMRIRLPLATEHSPAGTAGR
jgi:two-component system CheB/CheR fusion protein